MKRITGWKNRILSAFILLLLATAAKADDQEGWVCGPDGCLAAISEVKYSGWDAWRLCDGKTEAIVVPAIGRVMSFKTQYGENWLWNAELDPGKKSDYNGWKNWGGDKTWLSPQTNWINMGSEKGWPPPAEWEQGPFQAQVLSGGKLKVWGPVSPATGIRLSRVFYHNDQGEFVIEQTAQQLRGAPLEAGLWSITQVNGAKIDAVFLARGETSDYESGFRWMPDKGDVEPQGVLPTLLKVGPLANGAYKIGTDSPRAGIATVRDGWAFVERANRPDGKYPDGEAGKNGVSVELFGFNNSKASYLELELLSPLVQFQPGARWTHTVRWSVHQLPGKDVNDATMHAAIDKLLEP